MNNSVRIIALPLIIVLLLYCGKSQDTYNNTDVRCRFISKLQYILRKDLSHNIDNYLRKDIDVYLAQMQTDTIAIVLRKNDTNYSFNRFGLDTTNTYCFHLAHLPCLELDVCVGRSLDSLFSHYIDTTSVYINSWCINYLEYNPITMQQTKNLITYGQALGHGFKIDTNELTILKLLKEETKDSFSIFPFYYPSNKDDYLIRSE